MQTLCQTIKETTQDTFKETLCLQRNHPRSTIKAFCQAKKEINQTNLEKYPWTNLVRCHQKSFLLSLEWNHQKMPLKEPNKMPSKQPNKRPSKRPCKKPSWLQWPWFPCPSDPDSSAPETLILWLSYFWFFGSQEGAQTSHMQPLIVAEEHWRRCHFYWCANPRAGESGNWWIYPTVKKLLT